MRLVFRLIALLVLVIIAWASWRMPRSPQQPASHDVRASLPVSGNAGPAANAWRVVTRKLVWKKAAHELQERLKLDGFTVIPIIRRETVELHAFDDPRTFATSEEATRAEEAWKKKGIEAQVLDEHGHYGVALGRFFLPEYAETQQRALEKSGQPYHYEKRTAEIPVYRFTFPPSSRAKAKRLWQHLQDIGIAYPAIIREDRFTSLYGPVSQENSSTAATTGTP